MIQKMDQIPSPRRDGTIRLISIKDLLIRTFEPSEASFMMLKLGSTRIAITYIATSQVGDLM
jgi:hypothetical protein